MKNINILIIMTLLFSSCMDVIDLKVENLEPMLVLDGEINDKDEKQVLRLSLSQPYFQEGTKTTVDYAQITLFEDEVAVGTYENSNPGIYELIFQGLVGKKYRIEVLLPEIPEHPTLSGQLITSEPELLAPVTEITDVRFEYKTESLIFDEGYYLLIDTYDPKGKGNYYRWKLNINGEYSKDPRQIMVLDDDMVDGNFIEDLDLTFEPFKVGDEVTVNQRSISQSFYQYLMDIYMQALTQESFFDSPSYNPLSNLKAEIPVVGYFNASAYTEASIIVEEE